VNSDADVPRLSDDIIKGVAAIADFIGEPRRRVFYLLERGYLPAGKIGSSWVASRSALRAHYARVTHSSA
jgi:hypothetical protein